MALDAARLQSAAAPAAPAASADPEVEAGAADPNDLVAMAKTAAATLRQAKAELDELMAAAELADDVDPEFEAAITECANAQGEVSEAFDEILAGLDMTEHEDDDADQVDDLDDDDLDEEY